MPLSAQRSQRSRDARRSCHVAVFPATKAGKVGTNSSAGGTSLYRCSRPRSSVGHTVRPRPDSNWILTDTGRGAEVGDPRVRDIAQRRRPFQPTVLPRDGSRQSCIEFGCQYRSVVQRNQIDVFTEPAAHQMRTGKSSSADEVQPVTEPSADCRQQMGDQMIAFDLLRGNSELNCDTVTFVDAHAPPQLSARRSAAPCR